MKKQKSIQQDVEIDMSFGNNDDNSDDSDLSDSQVSRIILYFNGLFWQRKIYNWVFHIPKQVEIRGTDT